MLSPLKSIPLGDKTQDTEMDPTWVLLLQINSGWYKGERRIRILTIEAVRHEPVPRVGPILPRKMPKIG